jgi:hypothetical protein
MAIHISNRIHARKDPLRRVAEKRPPSPPGYHIIAQSAEDVQNIENAPALSMEPYLQECGQAALLRTISIYSLRGESRERIRLLYMNADAIRVWRQMGREPRVIGSQSRPPQAAILTLGVPFSS